MKHEWRKPNEYPRASAPLKRWAWEFLRRNPEYHVDFDALKTERLPYAWFGDGEHGRAEHERLAACGTPNLNLGTDYPHFPALSVLRQPLTRKWGIDPMADPDRPDAWQHIIFLPQLVWMKPGPLRFRQVPPDDWEPQSLGRVDRWRTLEIQNASLVATLRENEALIKVDVAAPIEEQLRAVKKAIKTARIVENVAPYAEREQRSKYRMYVRILDAKAEGATYGQIAAQFSREKLAGTWTEQRVADIFSKQITPLLRSGFRFLAAHA